MENIGSNKQMMKRMMMAVAGAVVAVGAMGKAEDCRFTKMLFFDDDLLFERENAERRYGEPELVQDAVYADGKTETVYASPWVFKLDGGGYRMIYLAVPTGKPNGGKRVMTAVSDDGIRFKPESATELMNLGGKEIGFVYEDPLAPAPAERYKLAVCTIDWNGYYCQVVLHTSADLLDWKRRDDLPMPLRSEPLMGAVFNHERNATTIIARPWWGVRKVGHVDTADWKTFSPYEFALKADSLDAPLNEIYGMPVFFYDGIYIGFPHVYGGAKKGLHAKYDGGTMCPQLAYSWDAHHWQRSLREPFIRPEASHDSRMVWPSSVQLIGNDVYIYAAAAKLEHGPAFHSEKTSGRIFVYRLRRDGFVRLVSPGAPATVATREAAWHSGEFHINLKARRATAAVYESTEVTQGSMNLLGHCRPVAGFTHADCEPFSGDSTDWTPVFKGGKMDSLKNRTLSVEVKFEDGELYSFSGLMTPLFNVPAERYRKTGKLGVR